MTVEEMHGSILLKIDKMGSYSTANLIPGEIDDFLNQAQRDFINQNRRYLREYSDIPQGVEGHEALRTLEKEEIITTVNSTSDLERGFQIAFSNLSESYDYYISGRVYFSTPDHWKTTRIVNKAFINDRSTTLYHESPVYSETPVYVADEELVGLYDVEDEEIPSKFVVSYLKEPKNIFLDPDNSSNNVDCELPQDVHRDIVDIAASKIIRSLAGQQQAQQQGS
jgi:hypothetical protein